MIIIPLTSIVLILSVLSSLSDIRFMRIPNVYSLIILGAFIPAYILSPESFFPLWHHLSAFAGMFIITFIMFAVNLFGSGDTKLASVLALWVGLKGLFAFLFYVAIMGGILAVLAVYFKKKKPFKNPREGSWIAQVQGGREAIPYGVAISIGAWAALFHTGFLNQVLDEVFKIIS